MNDKDLDAILEIWEAPAPSPALREGVRHGIPPAPRKRTYRWVAMAASLVATTGLVGVAMLGRVEAQLADGTNIRSTMQVEPAGAQERWHKLGFGSATSGNQQQGYWYDRDTHTYAGYDLTVQPMGNGQYLMTARPLGKQFRRLIYEADAAQYREMPLPTLPAARVVKDGEAFDIDLMHDAKTGDRVFVRTEVSRSSFGSFFQGFADTLYRRHVAFVYWLHSLFGGQGGPLRLDSPQLRVNGSLVLDGAGSSCSGNGIYFFLPGQGRYAMTLDPAGDRRFQAAGMVVGNGLKFTWEGNRYAISSQSPIAGAGEHVLYVLHEEAFRFNPELPELNQPSFGAGKPDPEH
jgi:hypothetical protein